MLVTGSEVGKTIGLDIIVHAGVAGISPQSWHAFAILVQDLVVVSLHLQLLCDGCWQLRHDLVELSNLISVDYCSLRRVEGHHVALRISSIKLVR